MMEEPGVRKHDLSHLQAEVEQEREFRAMLEGSVCELRNTLLGLQERLHSVHGEENEWRTRFETQLELNEQLERQICGVRERLQSLRSDPADRLASVRSYDEMSEDALRQRLKRLSVEKSGLQSQLRDVQRRAVLEGKAYQRVYEERRAYLTEISELSSTVDPSRKRTVRARRTEPGPGRAGQEEGLKASMRSRLPRLKR